MLIDIHDALRNASFASCRIFVEHERGRRALYKTHLCTRQCVFRCDLAEV